jgi:hypothetical protein
MRNQEVRTLRDKAASLEHRLERFEAVQVRAYQNMSLCLILCTLRT